ncbi:ORF77 [Leucania separata nucleopolyhedrovirus]|uniref:ORF77 n=1 Tax=Leucania separata nucleopolyhedrovirus TaxID=1307956 RepID=Q0IL42_NPVLS|nr:ORF77 [Leucania separata nucleopolyhedrovirus]AAR28841.1 ORF77 [Leucania separata nucleopolyhedrovirus]
MPLRRPSRISCRQARTHTMNLLELSVVATSLSPLTVVLDNRINRAACRTKKHLNIQTMGYTDELEYAKFYYKTHCRNCDETKQAKYYAIVLNCYQCGNMAKFSPKCDTCNRPLYMCSSYYF